MRKIVITALLAAATAVAGAQDLEIPDVPFERFVLDNGLTLLVHEDHKAPIVAVNIWYHVGSKNEKPGRTGFAHLFEHLIFNGSENFDDDYFKALERIGATELNGTTWFDRTNYFQNVPTNAVDVALWMESDRMGHFEGAITQERLDEQRGVVQNEKRQGENQPYGKVWVTMAPLAYPANHPYSWTTIGSMEDLSAASLEDVKEWFASYYGAANAVVAVVGDITPEEALEKVKHHFGDIPPGPPVTRQEAWVAKRESDQQVQIEDRVAQARTYMQWNVAEFGTADNAYLDLVSDVLARGKTSRLYERLVYRDQLATDVSAWVWPFELSGQFFVMATARPGVELGQVKKAIDEELARLLAEGPTAEEVERVKVQHFATFLRGIEGIGGFGGKSDLLATNEVYGGDPAFYKTTLGRVRDATAENLQGAARRWLSEGRLTIDVVPFPEYTTAEAGADRSKVPSPGEIVDATFPEMQRATLSNGMDVILVERDAVPLVELELIVDAGYASDHGKAAGTATLAMDMLDEGTESLSALEISERLAMLGADLGTGSSLDTSTVQMSALKAKFGESLDLFADVVRNPSFPAEELERLRQQQLARIQREKTTPVQMGLRVLPRLVYGEGHPYSLPYTGTGTEESVAAIGRDDLVSFHETWFQPGSSTLVAVGDTTLGELVPMLEARFGDWPAGEAPEKEIDRVDPRGDAPVYLIDRPGSEQSIIFAGIPAPPKANEDETAIEVMNTILGGSFTSRINMNLREDKGWSYGSRTILPDARGQRLYFVYAPVQTDKTKESVAEIRKELAGIRGEIPVSDDEIAKVKARQTLTLAGQWETNQDVLNAVEEIVEYGLAEDYHDTYADAIRAVSRDQVLGAAGDVVRPDSMVWVVVGDRSRIEPGIAELGLGEIQVLDADGSPVGTE